MNWTQTPLKGVWTGMRNGKSFILISFEASTKSLRGKKAPRAQID